MYVYIRTREQYVPYTVGFYAPDGEWHTDSDHETREQAAKRVHYLNGGNDFDKVYTEQGQRIISQ